MGHGTGNEMEYPCSAARFLPREGKRARRSSAGRPEGRPAEASVEGWGGGRCPYAGWEGQIGTEKALSLAGSTLPRCTSCSRGVRAGPVLCHYRDLTCNQTLREPHAPHEDPFSRLSLTSSTSVPSVARLAPTRLSPVRTPVALRPCLAAGLPVRGCSPFGSSASSAPGPLSWLPAVETRGFAPPPRGGFALSWFEDLSARVGVTLSGNVRLRRSPCKDVSRCDRPALECQSTRGSSTNVQKRTRRPRGSRR